MDEWLFVWAKTTELGTKLFRGLFTYHRRQVNAGVGLLSEITRAPAAMNSAMPVYFDERVRGSLVRDEGIDLSSMDDVQNQSAYSLAAYWGIICEPPTATPLPAI
jgi:hypothetical protein